MAHWSELQAQAPELAARGWALLARGSAPEGLLATVRGDGLLRIHPVNVGIVDGRLMTFIQGARPRPATSRPTVAMPSTLMWTQPNPMSSWSAAAAGS